VDETFRIARIAGIPIGINWSVLAVFWLIAWSLAGDRLPGELPGESEAAYWTAGTLTAAAFLGSLLAHELAHAIVARRRGIDVAGITLWLFGGIARLRGEAVRARDELNIAIVGPLTSLGLAAAFGLLSEVLDGAGVAALSAAAARWLARMNLALAIFNMVPAFPLDGGRVLRAILWERGGRARATGLAARAGRAFAYLLIGFGILRLGIRTDLGGLWLLFLGWFLLGAARSEESHVLLTDALSGLTARDVMSRDVVTAPSWLTVDSFIADYALQHRYATFPVIDFDGTVAGIVTLGGIKAVPEGQRAATRLRDIAAPFEAITRVGPDHPLPDLLERVENSAGRALVLENGRLVGMVTPRDIGRALDVASLRGARLPARTPARF